MLLKEIINVEEKSLITNTILRALPNWFGIEESIVDYVEQVKDTYFVGAYHNNEAIGFMSIRVHNAYSAEIYVTGILPAYHRKGLGQALIEHVEVYLKSNHYRFFMVKTLSESHPDPYYQKTRLFYEKVGFYPLEEIKELWGKENPCLLMIKSIGGNA